MNIDLCRFISLMNNDIIFELYLNFLFWTISIQHLFYIMLSQIIEIFNGVYFQNEYSY